MDIKDVDEIKHFYKFVEKSFWKQMFSYRYGTALDQLEPKSGQNGISSTTLALQLW